LPGLFKVHFRFGDYDSFINRRKDVIKMQEKGIEKKDLFVSITAVVLCAAFGMIYWMFWILL
jgi:hypothetical protein